jgi:putative Mg2+ transporter-C (MgtC) family protein
MTLHGEMVFRLLLGAALGGVIGYERERHGRAAGFRTNMAVCMASVLIMLISINFYHLAGLLNMDYIRIDPGRIAAGAITGVGFLGAGVVVRSGATVHGLTTAAIIWMVSIIGLTVGAGMYMLSVLATGLTVASLVILRAVEKRIRGDIYKELLVCASLRPHLQEEFDPVINSKGIVTLSVDREQDNSREEITLNYLLRTKDEKTLNGMVDELGAMSGVKRVQLKSRDR